MRLTSNGVRSKKKYVSVEIDAAKKEEYMTCGYLQGHTIILSFLNTKARAFTFCETYCLKLAKMSLAKTKVLKKIFLKFP